MKKLAFNQQDVKDNYEGALFPIYSALMEHLPKLRITKNVYQGDVLWTDSSQLKVKNIDGQRYLTFTPNTITYAVPAGSELAAQMQRAKVGIVFHTTYPTGGAETVLSMRLGGILGSTRRSGSFKTSRFISETTTRGCFTSVLIARSIASLCEVVGTSSPWLSLPIPLDAVPGVLNMTPDDNVAKRCLLGVSVAFISTLPSFPMRTSASYPNSRRFAIVNSKRSF